MSDSERVLFLTDEIVTLVEEIKAKIKRSDRMQFQIARSQFESERRKLRTRLSVVDGELKEAVRKLAKISGFE